MVYMVETFSMKEFQAQSEWRISSRLCPWRDGILFQIPNTYKKLWIALLILGGSENISYSLYIFIINCTFCITSSSSLYSILMAYSIFKCWKGITFPAQFILLCVFHQIKSNNSLFSFDMEMNAVFNSSWLLEFSSIHSGLV